VAGMLKSRSLLRNSSDKIKSGSGEESKVSSQHSIAWKQRSSVYIKTSMTQRKVNVMVNQIDQE